MNEERRAAQRAVGLETSKNLLSPAESLKRREAWKYAAIKEALGDRAHEFEFELGDYIFDLALFDTKTLVEFDGPYHNGKAQSDRDTAKEAAAEEEGYVVVRRAVLPSVTIDPSVVEGL